MHTRWNQDDKRREEIWPSTSICNPYLSLADVNNGLHEETEMNQCAPILPTEKLLKGFKVFPP